MSTRAVKYGSLFLIIPFLGIFLMDVKSHIGINSLSYLIVGAANLTFFVLLLSLCEHVSFAKAYAISSIAVILQVTLYCMSILKSLKRALWLTGAMSGLYGYLYFSLKDSENALLLGTCSIFAMICVIMFFTRNLSATIPTLTAERE